MELAGHVCVGSCEIDEYARKIYKKNFGEEPEWRDAVKLDPKELPDFDCLCAGFPCQAFSIAGKRLGFEESRGTLFFEIVRIAKQKRPRLLLLENVKGLLHHDHGKTFAVILAVLDELGYDAEWQVLNSKYFVPQNRERIFIIGHLREKPWQAVFPIKEGNQEHDTPRQKAQGQGGVRRPLVRTIDANYSKGKGSRTMIMTSNINANMNNRVQIRDITWTLTTRKDEFAIVDKKIRRLTPLECERLQGFPDGWTEGISDIQRYKCLGNAVTVPVIEFIAKRFVN